MEIEAKFLVPDEPTFALLQEVRALGPYEVRDTRTKSVRDRYLDTADYRFYNRNLFVRLREVASGLVLTIKGAGSGVSEGSIHTRDEYETEVPSLDVRTWPRGDVRRIVEETAQGKPLHDLFTLDQTRTISNLYEGQRAVAELSLDDVTIHTASGPLRGYELEIELLPEGLLDHLRVLSRLLTGEYGLLPQPKSKFERAMRLQVDDGRWTMDDGRWTMRTED
ncbi:MAG: CYTH domain-containing protein [Chloroflexota bacterium]|nr:CYTH domain-containing protein [Chloroflexota bacterium]MDQ5864748.1 CYTH domain-containing protein [Chloroflexota bacterium]